MALAGLRALRREASGLLRSTGTRLGRVRRTGRGGGAPRAPRLQPHRRVGSLRPPSRPARLPGAAGHRSRSAGGRIDGRNLRTYPRPRLRPRLDRRGLHRRPARPPRLAHLLRRRQDGPDVRGGDDHARRSPPARLRRDPSRLSWPGRPHRAAAPPARGPQRHRRQRGLRDHRGGAELPGGQLGSVATTNSASPDIATFPKTTKRDKNSVVGGGRRCLLPILESVQVSDGGDSAHSRSRWLGGIAGPA